MSLSQALNTSLSGLRATQTGLSLIASNIANAQTPGYVRKSLIQQSTGAGDGSGGVRVAAINRELDIYLQRQMRVELSGGSYASVRSDFYQRLQQIYGEPGSDSALETVFNNFSNSIQTLLTSPESASARTIVLSSAQVLAEQLNAMTDDIQALRGDTEAALADAVTVANNAMTKIAEINSQLVNPTAANSAEATLLDQRDFYVDQLAELMDIRVVVGEHSQLNVFTNSGVQLVGTGAAKLEFDAAGTVTPGTLWNADPALNSLGTLRIKSQGGAELDLISSKAIRSGKLAALIELRDDILVEAQTQLDSIAATLASALSDETIDGTAASVGPQDGFDLDTAGMLAGNRLSLTYTDHQTNEQHRVTIVRVDDPDALPLTDEATADPNDEVIGIDFSGGLPAAVLALNNRFGGRLQFSNAGSTLRVLDDGTNNRIDIDAFSLTQTASSITGSSTALPFFTDGVTPFSNAVVAIDPQIRGFAGRIALNPALRGDPARLVLIGTSTTAGDPTRPDFIYGRLTETSFTFSPDVGFGTAAVPFAGTLPAFMRQILSAQGAAADSAKSLAEGQSVVVEALQHRMNDEAGVNVDREMADLITLQTAYAANARVMSAVKDMIDVLLRI